MHVRLSISNAPWLGRRAVVTALAALAAAGHVGYPLLLLALTRRRVPRSVPSTTQWPGLSVVIPAYLEQNVIESKIADLARQNYPGPLDVVVVADDPETYRAASRSGARVLLSADRLGKSTAVNRGVAASEHEIVVLTDANTRLRPNALTTLVGHFADSTVGAVAGAKHVNDEAGQSFYWRFESELKRRESLLGTTMGLVGELAAFRRLLFRPLPEALVGDDLWLALDVIEQGRRVVFEPAAVAEEEGSPGVGIEWERRTRIVSGTLDGIWRRRRLLAPQQGLVAAQLWGHKLLRSSLGPLAHVGLLAYAAPAARCSWLARLFLLGHAVAGAGLVRVAAGGRLPTLLQLPAQVLFLQAVALGGLLRYLRGDRLGLWPKHVRLELFSPPHDGVRPDASVIISAAT